MVMVTHHLNLYVYIYIYIIYIKAIFILRQTNHLRQFVRLRRLVQQYKQEVTILSQFFSCKNYISSTNTTTDRIFQMLELTTS